MRRASGILCLVLAISLLALGIVSARSWRGAELAPYIPYAAVVFLGAALVAAAGLTLLSRNTPASSLKPMRPISWKWLVGGAAAVMVTTWVAAGIMMSLASRVNSPDERAKLEFDALKTSLTVGAGAAGVVALALGFRRQWLNERAQSHHEFDAGEQRVTELYTKAADQLGHDRAAVRLAGLYALERVAQNNVEHRQTIVNVICAYLRMPLPHDPWSTRGAADYEDRDPPPEMLEAHKQFREEMHVRDAAQMVLVKHVTVTEEDSRSPRNPFWPDIDLDLRGAVLRDFSLDGCRLRGADFSGARFRGGLAVVRTEFVGVPWGTSGPSGVGGVDFTGCKVDGEATFEDVRFLGDAAFVRARFGDDAYLGGVTFSGKAEFSSARFRGAAHFEGCVFEQGADFDEVEFLSNVDFGPLLIYVLGARFEGHEADFSGATFEASVEFKGAIFNGKSISPEASANGANFSGALAKSEGDCTRTWPDGWRCDDTVQSGYLPLVKTDAEEVPAA